MTLPPTTGAIIHLHLFTFFCPWHIQKWGQNPWSSTFTSHNQLMVYIIDLPTIHLSYPWYLDTCKKKPTWNVFFPSAAMKATTRLKANKVLAELARHFSKTASSSLPPLPSTIFEFLPDLCPVFNWISASLCLAAITLVAPAHLSGRPWSGFDKHHWF